MPTKPGEIRDRKVEPRPIDEEKSLRQRKGLDGDAIEEDRRVGEERPHEDIFDARAEGKDFASPKDDSEA
jgi:hypothetical protein